MYSLQMMQQTQIKAQKIKIHEAHYVSTKLNNRTQIYTTQECCLLITTQNNQFALHILDIFSVTPGTLVTLCMLFTRGSFCPIYIFSLYLSHARTHKHCNDIMHKYPNSATFYYVIFCMHFTTGFCVDFLALQSLWILQDWSGIVHFTQLELT